MTRLSNQNYDPKRTEVNTSLIQLSSSHILIDLLHNLETNKVNPLLNLFNAVKENDTEKFSEKGIKIIKKRISTILILLKELSPSSQKIIDEILNAPEKISKKQKKILIELASQINKSITFNVTTPVRVLFWFFEISRCFPNLSIVEEVRLVIQNQGLKEDELLLQLQAVFNKYSNDSVCNENEKIQKYFAKISKDVSTKINLVEARTLQETKYSSPLMLDVENGYSSFVLPNTRRIMKGRVEDRVITSPISCVSIAPSKIKNSMRQAIKTMSTEIKQTQKASLYKKKGQEIASQGSTFNGVVIGRNENNQISVCLANLGDSCAFHIGKNNKQWRVKQLTTLLHRSDDPKEIARIKTEKNINDLQLNIFHQTLKVSRSFGDLGHEEIGLSDEPDIILQRYSKKDIHPGFLLLATDGVHDVLSIKELTQLANQCVDMLLEKFPSLILNAIEAKQKRNRDDAAIVLIDLSKAQGFYAVCDGHGGQYVASKVAEQLPNYFLNELNNKSNANFIDSDNDETSPDEISQRENSSGLQLNEIEKVDDSNDYEACLEQFYKRKLYLCQQLNQIGYNAMPEFESFCKEIQEEITNLAKSVKLTVETELKLLLDEGKKLVQEKRSTKDITDRIKVIQQVGNNYQLLSEQIHLEIHPQKNLLLTRQQISKELDSLYDSARLACYTCDCKKSETIKKAEIMTYHNKYFKQTESGAQQQEYIKDAHGNVCSPLVQARKKQLKQKLKWSIFEGACMGVGIFIAGMINPLAMVVVGTVCVGVQIASAYKLFKPQPLTTTEIIQCTPSLITALPRTPVF